MSVDLLQEKIRKVKNPTVLQLDAFMQTVPQHLKEAITDCDAYSDFAKKLLDELRETVAAVRFGFASFSMLGDNGLGLLSDLLKYASRLGYYVLLDLPELHSGMVAESVAENLEREDTLYPCHGMIISCYAGSDVIRPFIDLCKKGKALFPVVRTANKSATEVQDLLTGARLVHTAAADVVNRHAETVPGKSGYCNIGVVAGASSADSLRNLRSKYKRLFLLLDGYDYPNANAKNCSYAFDSFGHGAAACVGMSLTAAWREAGTDGLDFSEQALQAALRMKKNLTRYITVL